MEINKIGRFRWRICALLFFATTINYVDRNVLSFIMLNDGFKHDMLGLDATVALTTEHNNEFKTIMGYIDSLFKFAYALGFILMGWFIDKVGTYKGYSFAILLWVTAALSHAFAVSVKMLGISRFFLGIGEAGNFPSAIKTVAEWFPKKERSLATGIFNAGANIGIIGTAFFIPYAASTFGWRLAFLLTSVLGFILLILWRISYKSPEKHPKLSKEELAYIKSDQEEQGDVSKEKLSWGKILPYKQTWAFAVGKFFTDCIWWFYIFWLPSFFAENANFKLNLKPSFTSLADIFSIGIPFLIIYIVSDLGSIFFGWLSSSFIQKGWRTDRARKFTMLLCALCVLPIFFASYTKSVEVAIFLIALAAAAHQGWSANLFTTVSDMFPQKAVSSVVGLGGMFGAIGGMILAALSGVMIKEFGYTPLFIIASLNYCIALLIIHLLVPKMEKVVL